MPLVQQNIFGFQVPVRPVAFEKFQRQAVELSGQVAEVRFVAGAGAPHNGFVERDSFDPVVHDHVAPLALPVGLPNVKLLPQEFLLIDRFEVLHRPCVAFEHFVPAAAADFENHRAVADPAQGFAVRRTAHFDFSQRAGQPIGILKSLDELADRMEHG